MEESSPSAKEAASESEMPPALSGESVEDDNWSRQVQADPSERGRLSASTSVLLEDTEDAIGMDSHLQQQDNDDDNWSRQVETDEIHGVLSSVMDEVEHSLNPTAVPVSPIATAPEGLPPPQREEPTLKEKLVERERQRRVETERARLKRQFAMRSGHEESLAEESEGAEEADPSQLRENGSVAGTVGEGSIVAPVDVLLEDDAQKQLNYPMERFLQEQGTILEEETTRETSLTTKRDPQNQGVVMERFLQDMVAVNPPVISQDHAPNVERSVSFDMESSSPVAVRISAENSQLNPPPSSLGESIPEQVTAAPPSLPSLDDSHAEAYIDSHADMTPSGPGSISLANASMDCIASEVPRISDLVESTPDISSSAVDGQELPPSLDLDQSEAEQVEHLESPSNYQPRVLGLTQAEIEELAAIEEASQQNAPPSERDDLSASSFVGELVSDLGPGMDPAAGAATMSQGTPTTAMESASILSGNQSANPTVSDHPDDQHSIDAMGTASDNSHAVVSSTGGGMSVTANPPSEVGHDDTPLSPLPDMVPSSNVNNSMDLGPQDLADLGTLNAGVVNRRIRPGMINLEQLTRLNNSNNNNHEGLSSPVRRVMSVPDRMHFDLEDFDYDKDVTASPSLPAANVPADGLWSPGSRLSVDPSPFASRLDANAEDGPKIPDYGAGRPSSADRNIKGIPPLPSISAQGPPKFGQSRALKMLGDGDIAWTKLREIPKAIFDDIRRGAPLGWEEQQVEAKAYFEGNIVERLLGNRLFVLLSTFLIEMCVLCTIMGSSDRLSELLGPHKFHFLLAFLPLSGAMSGTLGMQASAVTMEAIQFGHLSVENFPDWLQKEMLMSSLIGIVVGVLCCLASFWMSGFSITFGVTIIVVECTSAVLAGVVGTLTPPAFAFLFGHHLDKWHLAIQNAFLDFAGAFTTVTLNLMVFNLFGPTTTASASDVCMNA